MENQVFNSTRNPEKITVWIDLDDTIWDFKTNSDLSLRALYDHLDLRRFWPDVNDWLDSYHLTNDSLWKLYAAGEVTREELRRSRFVIPFTEAGMDADMAEELHQEADGYYLKDLGRRTKLVDGASELIERLRKRGYKLGILSNGFKEVQYDKLNSSGIADKFDTIVLSDEIDVNKPDIRLFRHAEKRARTTAESSIIIGDNPDTDIAGALNAGWSAIWFNPSEKPHPVSLEDLPDELKRKLSVVKSLSEIKL